MFFCLSASLILRVFLSAYVVYVVKQTTIHEFVTQQGYELVEKFGKTETSRRLKISRVTIDSILREYPTAPNRTIPKYVFQWEETEGNNIFTDKCQNSLRNFKKFVLIGVRGWLVLGKKDPLCWDANDFRLLWKEPKFQDPTTRRIRFEYATSLRKWMRVMGKAGFCTLEEFGTKGLKRAKGVRKQWFLEDDEIARLIEAIDRKDLLVAFIVSLLSGGRASSVMKSSRSNSEGIRPMDIDNKNAGILMYESKRKEYVPRLFHPRVIELLKRFIDETHVKANEPCFLEYSYMRALLKQAAAKAKISKIVDLKGTWHVTKHTFVSQGAYHGLSLEVLSEQTGTDANTLNEYYAGIKEKKMRLELLGEKADIEPFHAWSLRVIINPAIQRYERLLENPREYSLSE